MLLRDEYWRLWPHPLDWGPLGCPQVQESPCVVTMTTGKVAAFALPHSRIPEPIHATNHVAYCTLFITCCIRDVASSECKFHHFTCSVHCVVRYNVLVFRGDRCKDVVIRFSRALNFSVGVGGWWKLPNFSLISRRLFAETQGPQRKLKLLTPVVWFLNTVPTLSRNKLSCNKLVLV